MAWQRSPTFDGTLSLLNTEVGETYHNKGGAYTESIRVYVNPCELEAVGKRFAEEQFGQLPLLHLLDVCFGLGYNTWSWLQAVAESIHTPLALRVDAFEWDASLCCLWPEVLGQTCYGKRLQPLQQALHQALNVKSEVPLERLEATVGCHTLVLRWHWGKAPATVTAFCQANPQVLGAVDWIFHDAFSTTRQPELWCVELFHWYAALLKPVVGGLHTYSCARMVREHLQQAGFHTEVRKPPGHGKKSLTAVLPRCL